MYLFGLDFSEARYQQYACHGAMPMPTFGYNLRFGAQENPPEGRIRNLFTSSDSGAAGWLNPLNRTIISKELLLSPLAIVLPEARFDPLPVVSESRRALQAKETIKSFSRNGKGSFDGT